MSRPSTVDPWVDRVAAVEHTCDRILSWTEPPEPRRVWAAIASFDASLRGIGTVLADAYPLPVPATTDDGRIAEAVERVITAAIDGEEPPTDAVETARDADRITVVESGSPTVPLATAGAPVANWFVLVPVVADRLDRAAGMVERGAGRMELYDRDDSAAALYDVAGALRDTGTTVRNVATRTLWVNPPDGLVDAEDRRVREYVTRTMNAYNPVT
ncbi:MULTISPECIES: hypothetical protein [Halobaculum]|uniref:Uncharacterized protein n=2 Tax=Halobaculum TaxID=43927 RepID=A0A8T8WHZ1_9EURY|nr:MULTISPECIES: hypothetical protein [Halobaculum]QZP39458.1 hypothetical protein K6T50_17910 [Halobaculum magnesiiphilum]QZY04618.1 hypothetical protein K6T36_16810 [Halobaculum roseum]